MFKDDILKQLKIQLSKIYSVANESLDDESRVYFLSQVDCITEALMICNDCMPAVAYIKVQTRLSEERSKLSMYLRGMMGGNFREPVKSIVESSVNRQKAVVATWQNCFDIIEKWGNMPDKELPNQDYIEIFKEIN